MTSHELDALRRETYRHPDHVDRRRVYADALLDAEPFDGWCAQESVWQQQVADFLADETPRVAAGEAGVADIARRVAMLCESRGQASSVEHQDSGFAICLSDPLTQKEARVEFGCHRSDRTKLWHASINRATSFVDKFAHGLADWRVVARRGVEQLMKRLPQLQAHRKAAQRAEVLRVARDRVLQSPMAMSEDGVHVWDPQFSDRRVLMFDPVGSWGKLRCQIDATKFCPQMEEDAQALCRQIRALVSAFAVKWGPEPEEPEPARDAERTSAGENDKEKP